MRRAFCGAHAAPWVLLIALGAAAVVGAVAVLLERASPENADHAAWMALGIAALTAAIGVPATAFCSPDRCRARAPVAMLGTGGCERVRDALAARRAGAA